MDNKDRINEIERTIKNAQNQLDEAQAELKRLKEDGHRPVGVLGPYQGGPDIFTGGSTHYVLHPDRQTVILEFDSATDARHAMCVIEQTNFRPYPRYGTPIEILSWQGGRDGSPAWTGFWEWTESKWQREAWHCNQLRVKP